MLAGSGRLEVLLRGMPATAAQMDSSARLRASRMSRQRPAQQTARPKPRGQVLAFEPNKRRSQPSGTPSSGLAEVIPLREGALGPSERSAEAEMAHRAEMERARHHDRTMARSYALPDDLSSFAGNFNDSERAQIGDWWNEEMESSTLPQMLEARGRLGVTDRLSGIVNKKIEEAKRKAIEKVKEKAKEQFNKAVEKYASEGVKKVVWSGINQGSVIEAEGALLESWFGSGTVGSVYQATLRLINGGKQMIPEGTILSPLEPTSLKFPGDSQGSAAGSKALQGVGMLEEAYDLLVWLLVPIYVLLLLAVIALIHLIIVQMMMPLVFLILAGEFLGIL